MIALLLVSYTPSYAKDEVFKIAAIDWCPQICPNEPLPGYVIDVVEKIYQDYPIKIKIDYYPWSRAIKYVQDGTYDALLSPAKPEAPDLLYPKQAVGSQQMCFFVMKDFDWQYSNIASLKNLQIGIAQDTSIEELNHYVTRHPEQFQFQPYLDRYVEQNVNKIAKGRIDTFLFTKNTTLWELQKLGKQNEVKNAGCVSRAPIYLAFTPSAKSTKIQRLVQHFDETIVKMFHQGQLKEIFQRYNLSDSTWKIVI